MGLISPVSGRDTDTMVATGNSSKIGVKEKDAAFIFIASDCTAPFAMSFSDDIS